ncbi:Vacuolar protein-sorting-associated protein 27, partial [Globomyces sp. JEL0801]
MSLFFSNPLDPLVEKATNENIPVGSDDLVTCLDIVDLLKANKATPKHFTLAIKKRFTSKNPNVHLLTLALVDYCIKNAGSHVIIEIASRDFTDSLVALIQSSNNEAVLKKSLGLIQTWAMAFKGNQDLIYLCEAYDSLKRE